MVGPFSYWSWMVAPPMSCKIIAEMVRSCWLGGMGKFSRAMARTLLVCAAPKSFFSKIGLANAKSVLKSMRVHPVLIFRFVWAKTLAA